MSITPENSVLIVIDVQGKLAYLMQEKELLFKSIRGLIQTAYHLDIPFLYTEQVPEIVQQPDYDSALASLK